VGYYRPMRVLVLSARPELRANERFAEAARDLGINLDVVDAVAVSALLTDGSLQPLGVDVENEPPRAVLARVGNWRPESVLAVLASVVARGVATPNPPSAIRLGRDHWETARVLSEAGVPVPPSLAGADPELLAAHAASCIGFPVVVKQRRSRMGVGVIRCATRDHLEAVLDSMWRVGDEVLVQRWLPSGETTVRLLVTGAEILTAARFSAADGDWRSNAARGGSVQAHHPTADERCLAVAAARAVGLGQCGVDLVMSDDGPVVLEVNPTPGFLRLEEATGVDVARALITDAVSG
jgi:ribosomal protein S6--L-glutamate ligase